MTQFFRSKWYANAVIGLLVFYFISATMNQSLRIGGVEPSHHSQLWHLFHLIMGLSCLYSMLYRREWTFWWLITIFLWQIPVESYGAILVIKKDLNMADQIIEPFFNLIGLGLILSIRFKYFPSK